MRFSPRLPVAALLSAVLSAPVLACTIGVFSPASNSLGRPILWKNRDVNDENQAVRYIVGKRYRYITDIYAGDTLNAWAGINEAGFAVMNSNSFNLGGKVRTAADDGTVMNIALATCATVDDFARLLDSLNVVGRETPANFGAFDSTGTAAMFEASNTHYARFNAADDSLGFILRANYSMTGSPSRLTGKSRYDRAMELVVPAYREHRIDMPFLVRSLSRDMGSTFFDPYPFPFHGQVGNLPYGFVPTDSTICRYKTRSVEFIIGPRPGEPAARGMMWVMLGTPEAALPVPVWVQGGPVPAALGGTSHAALCDAAIRLRGYTRPNPGQVEEVNTFRAADVQNAFAPVESTLFDMVAAAEAGWPATGPTQEQAYATTAAACDIALGAYADLWDRMASPQPVVVPDSGARIWQAVAHRTVTIWLPASVRGWPLRVFDATGRKVATVMTLAGQSTVRWTPSGLRSGAYYVVFPSGGGLRPVRRVYLR